LGLTACLALAASRVGTSGWPADVWTWGVLTVGLVASWAAVCARSRVVYVGVILPLFLYVAAGELTPDVVHSALFDDRGGRFGVELEPLKLRFGRAGPNTRLLESHLGPLAPHWRHLVPVPGLFVKVRDGNDRVHSCNVIFHDRLPDVLKMLPADDARRQVLSCLTDPDNRLRAHQSLLLVCLDELGYPPGYDGEHWWGEHRSVFAREPNARKAARSVAGWRDAVERAVPLRRHPRGYLERNPRVQAQLRAVEYQERGSWGGHGDFGEAVLELEEAVAADGSRVPEGAIRVAWWPGPGE
jgi:hypothetical protein